MVKEQPVDKYKILGEEGEVWISFDEDEYGESARSFAQYQGESQGVLDDHRREVKQYGQDNEGRTFEAHGGDYFILDRIWDSMLDCLGVVVKKHEDIRDEIVWYKRCQYEKVVDTELLIDAEYERADAAVTDAERLECYARVEEYLNSARVSVAQYRVDAGESVERLEEELAERISHSVGCLKLYSAELDLPVEGDC